MGKVFAASLHRAKIIFTQNVTDKDNIRKTIGVNSVVIPNGHRLPRLPEDRRDSVLWVGRSVQFKRPELFINLAEKTPNEKFTMICQQATGDSKYDELVARAKQVKNLEFIERVGFDEIESYFQRAKAFVNTSDAEGFPNTFIQACKCATPILSLNVNPDGFLDRYDCGISCNGELEKLIDSLKFMLAENRCIELGKNGRKYVEEHHDITRIAEQYKQIFQTLKNS